MSGDRLLPSELDQLEAAGREVLADLAAAGDTMEEAAFARTLLRVTGLRITASDPAFADLLGRLGLGSWEERGVVLTALVTVSADDTRPTAAFFDVAAAIGLLAADATDAERAEAVESHRSSIYAT